MTCPAHGVVGRRAQRVDCCGVHNAEDGRLLVLAARPLAHHLHTRVRRREVRPEVGDLADGRELVHSTADGIAQLEARDCRACQRTASAWREEHRTKNARGSARALHFCLSLRALVEIFTFAATCDCLVLSCCACRQWPSLPWLQGLQGGCRERVAPPVAIRSSMSTTRSDGVMAPTRTHIRSCARRCRAQNSGVIHGEARHPLASPKACRACPRVSVCPRPLPACDLTRASTGCFSLYSLLYADDSICARHASVR